MNPLKFTRQHFSVCKQITGSLHRVTQQRPPSNASSANVTFSEREDARCQDRTGERDGNFTEVTGKKVVIRKACLI